MGVPVLSVKWVFDEKERLNMIKNFRYSSEWEDFIKAVDTLKELVKLEQAFFSVGFLSAFSLVLTDNTYLEAEVETIIYDEIVYLLRWYLECNIAGREVDEEEILLTLKKSKDINISEEEEKALVKNISNKLEFVKDAFDSERFVDRYYLKQNAVNAKLSDFKYNICSYNLPYQRKTSFALIDMVCKKDLRDVPQGIEKLFAQYEQGESITFICDEEDIDLMICMLEEMKQKIKGES